MEITSYLLGKKSSGGGGTDTRWVEIGYEEEPLAIQTGIDYAKEVKRNWDASITNRSNAFKDDNNLVYFPDVDMSNITNTNSMFSSCYGLSSVPDNLLNQFNGFVDARSMFYNDYSLVEVGDVDFSGYKGGMFSNCYSLKKIKSITINSNNSKYDASIFQNCSNLVEIGKINSTITSLHFSIFGTCTSLSNNTLKEILNFCKTLTSQGDNYKKLSTIGLTQTQANLCTTFDEWETLEEAGWTTGY